VIIATEELDQGGARELVRGCFRDLVAETEGYGGFVPSTAWPDLEVAEQQEMCLTQPEKRIGQASRVALRKRVADRAVQIHDMAELGVERFSRDVRLFRIYEGTSQILQTITTKAMVHGATAAN